MADIFKAIHWLKEGKAVKRKRWPSYYVKMADRTVLTCFYYDGGESYDYSHDYPLYQGDLDACDFEVYTPREKFKPVGNILNAISSMAIGKKVARAEWPDGHFIYLIEGTVYNFDGSKWEPTQTQVRANDWMEFE